MTAFWAVTALWLHFAACAATLGIAAWMVRRWLSGSGNSPEFGEVLLFLALIATSFWAGVAAVSPSTGLAEAVTESLRNLAWLGFMFHLARSTPNKPATVFAVYGVLAIILFMQPLIQAMLSADGLAGLRIASGIATVLLLRMIFAVGALLLVNNLYTIAAPESRSGLRVLLIAIGAMWFLDLNLYTFAWLGEDRLDGLVAIRGLTMLVLVPFFAIASRRDDGWTLTLSRKVAYGSLSAISIGVYLAGMILLVQVLQSLDNDVAQGLQVMLVAGMLLAALMLLPSARFRSWFKVKIAKHFFKHRYDYRQEWLRFTETIGRPGDGTAPFSGRVIKALADITDSPSGLLLAPNEGARLQLIGRFNWPTAEVPATACTASTIMYFQATPRVIELDQIRNGADTETDRRAIPDWVLEEHSAWAIVPLVHFDRLAGLVVLSRPLVGRQLDWEDFDLLRVAGRQVASYLSEARSQEALLVNEKFDEFNRRFAFVMHDIKNLVSQLSLVARNAERHADNPEFRADMIATLQNSVGKMNTLLARLSHYTRAGGDKPEPVDIERLVEAVVADKAHRHDVRIMDSYKLTVMAVPAQLEQVFGHLIQNAIDASRPDDPVFVRIRRDELNACVEIIDKGSGMSADFVRTKLFQPFISSKPNGFGIGAYEAKTLVEAINGRIDVESREGNGTRFAVRIPLAVQMTPYVAATSASIFSQDDKALP